ncbi:Replication protein A 70 kDa DNA-binding subunit B, partial [Bienertia sinuspersici]
LTSRMKKEYNYLNELTDKSKNFKVKVIVTHKARPKQSPRKKKSQRLIMQDEKGNTMRGAIFEDDIQTSNNAIQRNKQYVISDAIIQPVPEQYQMNQNKYQMKFNERMTLIPLTGQSSMCTSPYLSINEIPRSNDTKEELVDVLGIVMFVGETCLVPINGSDVPVRDIIITDDSTQHSLLLSAWDDLAEDDSDLFKKWSSSFIVVGFTAMCIKAYNGFSLGSTMSTEILVDLTDEKAKKL